MENKLEEYIYQFNENINGQREFIALIDPFLKKQRDKALREQKKLEKALKLVKERELSEEKDVKKELNQQIKKLIGDEVILAYVSEHQDESDESDSNEIKDKYIIAAKKSSNFSVEQLMEGAQKAESQKELLYKNSLISILSSVEWFFSQVLHFYYDKYPDAAGIKKKTLTLEDLKTFGNVNDAEKFLIDQKIEETFRGGFESWIRLLKEEIKIKLKNINEFVDELVETYQRRNLLVHNGGRINSIYLSKVNHKLRKDFKIGDDLSVTPEYLNNAIERLHIVFTLIAAELWQKLEPQNERRAGLISHISYENMISNRWKVSEELSAFIMNEAELPSKHTSIGLLNYWLSKKRLGEFGTIKKDIDAADFSDKSLLFRIALMALKDESDAFFENLPRALENKDLEIDELLEFPIFKEMRDSDKFEEFKKNSKFFKKLVEEEGSDSQY